MGLTLFSGQTPGLTDESDNTYNLGTEIVFARDVYVLGGRRFASVSAISTSPFHTLWSVAGAELARVAYGANATGAWNTALFATPVQVAAGTRVVSAYGPVNRYVATVDLLESPLTNGDVTAPANGTGGVTINGRFVVSPSVTYPDGNGGGNCYFADVIYGDVKTGVVNSALGALSAVALSSVSAAVAETSGGGGWYSLLSVYREGAAMLAEDAARPVVACPNDGEPLRMGRGGVLYCPYDGWRPS